jgi:hypothetical protein
MLQIDPIELANRLQRPGGTDWVAFMDNLLWAACWQVGVPESAVRTNRAPFAPTFVPTAKTAVWIHG